MKILIFGGSGCIGSNVVELLLKHNFELTLLNRGTWPWGTSDVLKPRVKWLYCDRDFPDRLNWTELESGAPYTAVLDFSACSTQCIRPFYRRLKKLSRHYVYISCASVYEMCCLEGRNKPLQEDAGVRPEDLEARLALARMDSYADGKLLAEEFLMEERQLDGMSFTVLRLPDVLGARDGTNRFWLYQVWLQLNKLIQKPITVPTGFKELPSSYVYVADVANCILSILLEPSKALDQVFNFASYTLTLQQLLAGLQRTLKVQNPIDIVETGDEQNDAAIVIFPSTTTGPIDCSRINERYEIPLTDLNQCLQTICDFYTHAATAFGVERDRMIDDLCELVQPSAEVRSQLKTAVITYSESR